MAEKMNLSGIKGIMYRAGESLEKPERASRWI